MTKNEKRKRVKLNSNAQHCNECLEKDERIKSLEMLVESLTAYVSLVFEGLLKHSSL